MPEGAKLAIIERLLPARAADDPAAIMLDLHMMTITGGRARSFAEFRTLLSGSRRCLGEGHADKLRPRHHRSQARLIPTAFPGGLGLIPLSGFT